MRAPRRRLGRTLVLVCLLAAAGGGSFVLAADPDFDRDGVDDGRDNCPLVPNGLAEDAQRDRDADGHGDACECGDVTGDGTVDGADAERIRACARGDASCPSLCDVTGDGSCTPEDAARIDALAADAVSEDEFRCLERPACGNGQHDPGEACEDALDPFCCLGCRPRNEGVACEADGIACTEDRCHAGRCQDTTLRNDLCSPPAGDCRVHACTSEGCQPVIRPGETCGPEAGCCDCPPPFVCIPRGPFPRRCDPEGTCSCEEGLVPVPCP